MTRFPRSSIVLAALLVAALVAIGILVATRPDAHPATAGGAGAIAGRVGERAITVAEVDARWRSDAVREQAEAMRLLYEGRKTALDRLIADALIGQAADAAGESAETFLKTAIAPRIQPITEADVLAFYAANQERLDNRPLEELRPSIASYLDRREREKARLALVNELASGTRVTRAIEPPRHDVRVEPDDPAVGAADAPVTIVAFSDFQCPFCARVKPTLEQLRATYGDDVRVVWKDFPLTSIHPQAFRAAEASRCAAEQEKYFEYHARLFEHQQALDRNALSQYASEIGIDTTRFEDCLESGRYTARVQRALDHGTSLGVQATPALFINGRHLDGAQPFDVFAAIIDDELGRARRE